MRRLKRTVKIYTRKLYALADKLPSKLRFLAFCIPLAPLALVVLTAVLISSGGKNVAAVSTKDMTVISAGSTPSAALAGFSSGEEVLISAPTPSPTPTVVPTPSPTPDPTLQRGDENEEVTRLQQRLMKLGYLDIDEPTLLFGPATEASIKLFQRQVGAQQDGIAGVETLALIYADDAPKYVIKQGMEGDDIADFQRQLVDLGYMNHTTGYFGDETVAAVKEFQSRNGLSADGLVGEYTFDLLYSDAAKPSASKAKEARRSANIGEMIEYAKAALGKKYILGNEGPNSFDCSGLVYYCLNQAGSNRRRLNAAGYSGVSDWEKITNINDLKKGDLIFFYDDGFNKVGHVGIVISSTHMIDASSSNGKVVKREYKTSYWKKHFVCGRRPW